MRIKITILFFGLLLLIVSQSAVAQGYRQTWKLDSTGLFNKFELDSITVSGSKRESSLLRLPISATSISSVVAERERLINLTTLSARIPGLYMADYGSKLTAPIYIRGVGSRINEPSVGLYIDDVPVFDKSGFNFDLISVKRIEVLRGPQGTLYGRNTMGGIIHVITREPGNSRETSLSADFGGYGTGAMKFAHIQPLVKDKLSLELSGLYRTRSGFHTNEFLDEQVDWLRSGAGRIKLLYTPSPATRIQWIASTDISREGGYPYGLLDLKDSLGQPQIGYDYKSSYNRKIAGTSLKVDHKMKNMHLTGVAGYQYLGDIQSIDQDFSPRSLVSVIQDQNQSLFTTEVALRSHDNKKFEWVAGVHGFRQLTDRRVDVTYGDDGVIVYKLPAPQIKRKDYAFGNTGVAVFGQFTLKDLLIRGLDMTMGIRADLENDRLVYRYNLLMNDTDTRLDTFNHAVPFHEILPKFSLNYRIGSAWMTYASVTKGYKSGGFNSTFEREEDQTFGSEFSWNYEAGLKVKTRNNRLMANASVYYIDWKNQQIYQPVPSGQGSMLVNAGKTASKGFEVEGSVIPVKNFVANFAWGYTFAQFTDYVANPAKGIDYTGNMVPYAPRYTWFTGATYRLPFRFKLLDEVRLSASMQGIGKIYWNDANSLEQKAYQLLSARMEFFYRSFSLAVWGSNLLNSSYNVFLFQALGNTYAQPGQPRLVGMTLSTTF